MEAKTFWESLPTGWAGTLAVVAVLAVGFNLALKWLDSRVESAKSTTKADLQAQIARLEERVTKLETAHSAASKAIVRAIGHAASMQGEAGAQLRGDLQAAYDALN